MNTCSLAQSSVGLRTKSQVYHYTLYYYDQADNLVRTVPPEGVNLISQAKFKWIDDARAIDPAACEGTFQGLVNLGLVHTDVNGSQKTPALNNLSSVLSTSTNAAIEMWLYNPNGQANQFMEETPDKHYLFQVCICGSLLNVDVYSSTPNGSNSITYTLSNHVTVNIGTLLPLYPWSHVVVRSSNFASGALQVFLNGTAPPAVPGSPPAGCSWSVTANPSSISYPDNMGTLKHLRFYNRYMPDAEIAANAANNCFLPSNMTAATWYRFNVPAAGSTTTIAANTTDETRLLNIYPDHTLPTSYVYNSTNQVIKQYSPDGGINKFWYDLLSRLTVSQNAEQAKNYNYSYTKYDTLGRITEVGQKNTRDTTLSMVKQGMNQIALPGYLTDASTFLASGMNSQITRTYYDDIVPAGGGLVYLPEQSNLRKRVAASAYIPIQNGAAQSATYYNYDIDGNVKTLWQQIAGLDLKRLDYEYDLVSGKVNFLSYQKNQPDQFYYQYKYDADNRITDAWSGTRALFDVSGSDLLTDNKKLDAHYDYYLHGPLARMELGDEYGKVQGVDYAYTLQGWLKGVNGQQLNPNTDMGGDGYTNNNRNGTIAKDAYGYALGYYQNDYQPIGNANSNNNAPAFNLRYQNQANDYAGQNLYNGNISNTTLAISALNSGAPVGYTYRYDQLNRLKAMRQHTNLTNTNTWNSNSIKQAYKEDYNYDGNGNIKTLNRNGNPTTGLPMDSLSYAYNYDTKGRLSNNKLKQVRDAIATNGYTDDLKNQSDTANYRYDATGNLIHDTQANIDSINWTVYGKIQAINKTTATINYTYSPAGQRISKNVNNTTTTFYVRDAQGNTLALYDNANNTINWKEQHLYGSSRLGIFMPNINTATGDVNVPWNTKGLTFYELNNHLGNVLTTITDRRLQHDSGNPGSPDYVPDVATANDYYAFGSLMPGRSFAVNDVAYRYGFNGKEMDNSINGIGVDYDYGMRISDSRTGRFFSVDPLSKQYPWYTPYQFAGNTPIQAIDIDGAEPYIMAYKFANNLNPQLNLFHADNIVNMAGANNPTSFNSLGWERQRQHFWDEYQNTPLGQKALSSDNLARIDAGKSARVNEQWNSVMKQFGNDGVIDEIIHHHHHNKGPMAFPVPASKHVGADAEEAMHSMNMRLGGISQTTGRFTGRTLIILDIASIWADSPNSIAYTFHQIGTGTQNRAYPTNDEKAAPYYEWHWTGEAGKSDREVTFYKGYDRINGAWRGVGQVGDKKTYDVNGKETHVN